MDEQKTRKVISLTCPICKNKTEWQSEPRGPFCSERCRLEDLGNWASNAYSIPIMNDVGTQEEKDRIDPRLIDEDL